VVTIPPFDPSTVVPNAAAVSFLPRASIAGRCEEAEPENPALLPEEAHFRRFVSTYKAGKAPAEAAAVYEAVVTRIKGSEDGLPDEMTIARTRANWRRLSLEVKTSLPVTEAVGRGADEQMAWRTMQGSEEAKMKWLMHLRRYRGDFGVWLSVVKQLDIEHDNPP
jgi:hypothetical protein